MREGTLQKSSCAQLREVRGEITVACGTGASLQHCGLQAWDSDRQQHSKLPSCVAIQVNLKCLLEKKGLSASNFNVVPSAEENWQEP